MPITGSSPAIVAGNALTSTVIGNGRSGEHGNATNITVLASAGNVIVGVGMYGTSWSTEVPTGTWTKRTLNGTTSFRGVAYGVVGTNGVWVAVGDDNSIYYASDPAETWSLDPSAPTGNFYGIAFGQDATGSALWVIVGDDGGSPGGRLLVYGVPGVWDVPRDISGFNYRLLAVATADGYWVAVGYGQILTSTDPTGTWAITNYEGRVTGHQFTSVTNGGGYWVAVGDNGLAVAATAMAGPWRLAGLTTTDDMTGVAYGNGYFAAVGAVDGSTTSIWYVANPFATWTTIGYLDTAQTSAFCIHYANESWLIGTGIYSSTSGVYCASVPSGPWARNPTLGDYNTTVLDLHSPPEAETTYYVAAGPDGALRYATNSLGPYSAPTQGPNANVIRQVVYGGGYWVAVGVKGEFSVGGVWWATDPTGTWTGSTSFGLLDDIYTVAFANGWWVAGGYKSYIRYTKDPTGTWSTGAYLGGSYIQHIAYGDDRWLDGFPGWWVAVGTNGLVRYATDPSGAWSTPTGIGVLVGANLQAVTFGTSSDGYQWWVAVAATGQVAYTNDPSNIWSLTYEITGTAPWSLAYGDGYWVVGGQYVSGASSVLWVTNNPSEEWRQTTSTGLTNRITALKFTGRYWLAGDETGALSAALDPFWTWTPVDYGFTPPPSPFFQRTWMNSVAMTPQPPGARWLYTLEGAGTTELDAAGQASGLLVTTQLVSAGNEVWGAIAYGAGYWAFINSLGEVWVTSALGVSPWQKYATITGLEAFVLRYHMGYWVVVGSGGNGIYCATDPTGTWTPVSFDYFPPGTMVYGVAYGNGYWVAVGENNFFRYTNNPATSVWTSATSTGYAPTDNIMWVEYGDGYWVMVSALQQVRYTFNPFGTWTASATLTASGSTPWGIAFGATSRTTGEWVVILDGSPIKYATNPAGPWSSATITGTLPGNLWYIAYGNGYWAVIGWQTGVNERAYVLWSQEPSSGFISQSATPPGFYTNGLAVTARTGFYDDLKRL